MASFDIGLYITQELYDKEGNTPLDRAKTYVDEAINYYSPHTASIHAVTSHSVSAPSQELPSGELNEPEPCVAEPEMRSYGGLVGWWADYADNCDTKGNDATVLITNGDYGGTVGVTKGDACVCEGGSHIADLPSSYEMYGSDTKHKAVNTVIHEIGHVIINDTINHHEAYNTLKSSNGNWGETAMETGAISEISENECGHDVHSQTGSYQRLAYSLCAENNMG